MAGWIARQVVRGCKVKRRTKTVSISLQEVYLRDDIPCGSAACRRCSQNSPPLPADVSHYVIPDVDAILQFWEVLELSQVIAVILLASVLKEVQLHSNFRWRRLRSIYTDKRRQNLYFDDEHFIFTRLSDGRGVEKTAAWFHHHLGGLMPIVVMTGMTHNQCAVDSDIIVELFQKSLSLASTEEKGVVEVLDAANYFGRFWSHDSSIVDLCTSLINVQAGWMNGEGSIEIPGSVQGDGRLVYKEHMAANAIEEDLATGSLRAGIFHVSRHAPFEGFVRPTNKGEASKFEIFVPSRKLQNRALHGDLVAVRLIARGGLEMKESSQSSHLSLPHGLFDVDGASKDDESLELLDDAEDEAEHALLSKCNSVVIGEVVGVLQRIQRDYVACLDEVEEKNSSLDSNRQEHLLCVPMDIRVPKIRIATRQRSRLVCQRFVLRIDGWDMDSKTPRGHLVRILGPIGDLSAENMAILVENEINVLPYSTLSLQELPDDLYNNSWAIPQEEHDHRRDIRFCHRTCSIDPPGSKDVDDCLSVAQLPNNMVEVGVHIADVSYFIKQGSLLDLEAFARGTTVYLVGNTYHMLPSILSENLCSLCGGQDRLAVSVIWTLDPQKDFEIFDVWFGRTIIQSRHQMFYAQAQAVLDGQELPSGWEISGGRDEVLQLQADLAVVAGFAQSCRYSRYSQGALELASTELRFDIDDSREPVRVDTKLELPMNWIVAELMIQANSFVAQRIYEMFPKAALLRRHPPPKSDNFTFLLKCCEAHGFTLDTSSNKALAASLDRIRDSGDPTLESAFKVLATRAMSEAEYVSTGDVSQPDGLYHYGLALEFYTHFTSPIRRYTDIVAHRMLVSTCQTLAITQKDSSLGVSVSQSDHVSGAELSQVACHLNERHRASKKAQKECEHLHLLMYLEKHAQAEQGVVISLLSKGFVVFVPKYDIKGQVHLLDKNGSIILPAKDDATIENENNHPLIHTMDKYELQYHDDKICILDSKSGRKCYEYTRMASVWVQLKADGSRARTPSLRVRLLSNNHPAVMAAQASKILQDLSSRSRFWKHEMRSGDANRGQTAFTSPKKLSIKEKADPLKEQGINDSTKRGAKLVGDMTYLTVNQLLEDLKLIFGSASSIYLDYEINDSELHTKGLQIEPPKHSEKKKEKQMFASGCTPLLTTSNSKIAVGHEESPIALLRETWRKVLGQAAVLRARHLRSTSVDESDRQQTRKNKELKFREKANLLSTHMGIFHNAD